MGIFKKASPEDTLSALRLRADKLEGRRVTAQGTLEEAKVRRQQHLLEADLDQDERTIGRLENDVVAATSRLAGLVDALAMLHGQIADAEAKLQAEVEQKVRSESAAQLTAQVVELEGRLDPMLVAMRAFCDGCVPLESLSFEISQLRGFIPKTIGEVEVCAGFVAPDLRLQIEMIRDGQRAVPKSQAEVIELIPVTATATSQGEETQLWFAVRPLRWRGKDGTRYHAERWSDIELPARLVPRASQRGAIAPISDARRKDHKGLLSSFTTPEHAIIDLDAELLPPPQTDLPEGFEKLDRGPARTLMHQEPRR